MARIFGKLLGKKNRTLALARAAELRGELAQAAALFAQSGRLDEAARVMVLRGDAEAEPSASLRHYVQAVATAPKDSSIRTHARRRHSSTVLSMAADAPMTATSRRDLAHAAGELEDVEDYALAAQAYARAGDVEGQARALARAGDLDALDALLEEEQRRDRKVIARRQVHDEVTLLLASGRRREALEMALASDDAALHDRGRSIERRRVAQNIVNAALRGRRLAIALGDEIVIGRAPSTEGFIAVASAAVRRRHVAVTRRDGEVVVRDLGSRNSTTLRGLALTGEAPVGNGIELYLGREVPLVVRPATELAGAVAIEVAGVSCIAPLGPAMLGVGRWRLERADDGWIELATDDRPPAFAGSVRLAPRITLLAGDAIAAQRDGATVLEVGERGR
jgi:FHA domain-containing protein